MVWILRLPATFVALIKRCSGRFFGTTFGTKLTGIYGTTGAGPAYSRSRFWSTALRTELAGVDSTAGTGPAAGRGGG